MQVGCRPPKNEMKSGAKIRLAERVQIISARLIGMKVIQVGILYTADEQYTSVVTVFDIEKFTFSLLTLVRYADILITI